MVIVNHNNLDEIKKKIEDIFAEEKLTRTDMRLVFREMLDFLDLMRQKDFFEGIEKAKG